MKTTLREIARQAQVHHGTVSIVLNGSRGGTRVSDETRQRVLTVAQRLGYQPNRAAQQLKTRRSNVVGLLVGDLENPFFARLTSLCTTALAAAGFDSVLAMRRQGEVSDLHHLKALASRQVDGLILWSETATEIRTWLAEATPEPNVVVLGHQVPGYDSVDASLATGVHQALEHLISQGRRRIGYLAPQASLEFTGDPRPGACREMTRRTGLLIPVYTFAGVGHSPEAACRRAEEIARLDPSERPDALFCFNDLTAIGALLGLRRGGLRVPQDIAVVGCDGLPLAAQMDVASTSFSGSRIIMQRPRLTGYGLATRGEPKSYEVTAERAEQ
ncbi:MAG: LacI family DNA-binding transcriptional regulator, partial [Armatimonadota bacterium]